MAVRVASGAARLPSAANALGAGHPVARAADARRALERQLATASTILAVAFVGVGVDGLRRLGAFLAAAGVVEACVAIGLLAARACLRERARDMIADGGDVAVAEVSVESRRLVGRRHRAVLATTLARAADAADRWHALALTTRPPPSVRNLAGHRATIDDVIALVVAPGTPVRAVALLDRLVRGGYAAPLYVERADDVARELARIRTLLAVGTGQVPGREA